jgi:N-methylhydantoinase B
MIQDKVLLEILRNRFQAIGDEMASVAFRTAHTVVVKETQDFATALVTPKGEIFAAPKRYGVLIMLATPMDGAIRAIGDDVEEGDIFMSNDPIGTEGMCTHLTDVYFWKPIFYNGELICYAWSFIHSSDVGGKVPGSISPSNYEIYQEGIRIPPRKLFYKGKLDEPFLNVFLTNCRIPDQNWGDIKACIASLNTAERRVHTLLDQYGPETVSDGMDSVLDWAETQSRREIRRVPNGVYSYVDYMEGDKQDIGMIRIRVDLHVNDDEFLLDYTGTDPQVRASLNMYSYSKTGHWNIIIGLIHWLCTMQPDITYNAGMVRPFKVHIPKGTLLNAEPYVACGNRSAVQIRMTDVNLGALAQAIPDEVPSFGPGQASILLVSVPDFKTGGTKLSVIQPLIGGSGGRPNEDGIDGVDAIWNFLKNVPTESIENDMPPLLINKYALRPDSGGVGKYRGGMGVELEFMTTSPYTVLTSRAMDRYLFQPPGRLGGGPGATGYTSLNHGSSRERDIGKVDVLEMGPGETLRVGTQGGGGFGDPLDRPLAAIVEDIRNGLVTPGGAFDGYGVVVDTDGVVDESATAVERQKRAAVRPATPPLFSFGAARNAYRRLWTLELEDAIAAALHGRAALLKQFLHKQLRTAITDRFESGEHIEPSEVAGMLSAMEVDLAVGYPRRQERAQVR